MDQPEKKAILSSEVFQMWQRRAAQHPEFADEWQDYALMMAAFQTALQRAPLTAEACDGVDIEYLLITELEHVADTINAVFPHGGMAEFASYVTDAQRKHAASTLPNHVDSQVSTEFVDAQEDEVQTAVYQPRNVSVGHGSIIMTSEDFINGYQAGHLSYMVEARTVMVTDEALMALILDKLTSVGESERYSVGYIVGWIAALVSKEKKGGLL